MKKLFFLIFTTMNLGALTLDEAVTTALHTHPIVQERLNNFRATQQELKTAEAEYYPTIDFEFLCEKSIQSSPIGRPSLRAEALNGLW